MEKEKEVLVNFLLNEETKRKYKIHCISNKINLSDRLRDLIEMDLKGEIEFKSKSKDKE